MLGEFIASEEGLGHRLLIANAALKLDFVFALLFLIGIVSVSFFLLIDSLERKLVRWGQS
jgi:NitT/TauT family transport system permease protein